MSQSIDERIVEMQFRNDQFERGIRESRNSLDKLKDSLNLEKSTGGIGALGKAFDNLSGVSLPSVQTALEHVGSGFSALKIMATSALATVVSSVTSSAMNMAKSLSIDQVTEGFSKYEEIIRSTRTIMASTGKTVDEVGEKLGKLNWFTDETSYNMSDMTNNIAKFTSAGRDLGESVDAMIGIANWAAVSGQNAQTASRAMYNMSQALAAGKMQLIDWRSIEIANMSTVEFKQTVIDTALALGKLVKVNGKVMTSDKKLEVTTSSFNSTLAKGWFTSDVIVETLKKYANYTNEVYDICQKEGISAAAAMDQLADSTDELGKKAFQAGQESKTFKDAIDATKDAVSSQWMKTFELLFGNLEEAVSLWTEVTDILWKVFAASGVARNELLQVWHDSGGRSSLLNAFQNLYDIIEAIAKIASSAFHSIIPPMTAERLLALTKGFEAFTFRLKEAIGFVTDFKDSVTNAVAEIINGDPGETIEDAVLTTAAKADAEKAKSVYDSMPEWMKQWADKNSDISTPLIRAWSKKGNFDKWAEYQAAKFGIPIDLIKKQYDAYNKLNDTAKNRIQEGKKREWADGKSWSKSYTDAWNAYFDAADAVNSAMNDSSKTSKEATQELENVGDAADESAETAYASLTIYEKLTKIVRGFASVISIAKTIGTELAKGAGKLVVALKPLADVFTDILAEIGDWLVRQDEAIKKSDFLKTTIDSAISFLKPAITGLANVIRFLWTSFKGIYGAIKMSGLLDVLKNKFSTFWDWLKGFGNELQETGVYGIVNVVKGFGVKLVDAIEQFFLIDTSGEAGIKEKLLKRLQPFLDIFGWIKTLFTEKETDSQSDGSEGGTGYATPYLDRVKQFFNDTLIAISSFIDTVKSSEAFAKITDAISSLIDYVSNVFSTFKIEAKEKSGQDFISKILDYLVPKALAEEGETEVSDTKTGLEQTTDTIDTIGDIIKKFGESVLNVIQTIAEYVVPAFRYAIQTGLTIMKLYKSVVLVRSIYALSSAANGISKALKNMAKAKKAQYADSLGDTFLKMAGAILMVAGAIWIIGTMDPKALNRGAFVTAVIAVALIGISAAFGAIVKKLPDAANAGDQMKGIGTAILMIAGSIIALGLMPTGVLLKGGAAVATILGALLLFSLATKVLKLDNSMNSISGFATGILLIAASIIALGLMPTGVLLKGGAAVATILGALLLFSLATKVLKLDNSMKDISGLAKGILLLVVSIAILGMLPIDVLAKGILSLVGILVSLGVFLRLVSKTDPKKALPAILGISLILITFAGCIDYIKDVPWQTIAAFSAGLSAIVLALSNAITLLAGVPFVSGLKAIGLLSAAVLALGAVFGIVLNIVSGTVSSAIVQLSSAMELAGSMISGFMSSMDGISGAKTDKVAATFEKLFGIIESVPSVGTGFNLMAFSGCLSQLGSALGLFIEGSAPAEKGIDSRVASLDKLIDAVLKISGSEIKNVDDFVGYLTSLGGALALFAGAESGITDDEATKRLNTASGLLTTLVTNMPTDIESVLSTIPDSTKMSVFSANLVALGGALLSFSNSVSEINQDKVDNAIDSLGLLNVLDKNLKRHGGVFDRIAGIASLDTFATSVKNIGNGLNDFATSTSGIDPEKTTFAINSLGMLNSLDISLKRHGGVFGWLAGESNLATFATNVNAVGTGLKEFSTKTQNIDSTKVTNATNALSVLAAIDGGLTNHGGVISFFTGDQTLSDLGDNLGPLGEGLASFCKALDGVGNIELAVRASTVLQKLAVADTNLNLAGSVLQLQTFAGSLHNEKGTGVGQKLAAFSTDLAEFDSQAVASATTALTNLSLIDSNNLEALAKKFKDGILSPGTMSTITSGITTLMSSIASIIRSRYGEFYSAGIYLDSGLAMGIMNGSWRAENAAQTVASRIILKTKQALAINSPSRIGSELGMYWDKGIAGGMYAYSNLIDRAAESTSESMIQTASGIVATVSSLMSGDMDLSPTITPVIDMSNIRAGMTGVNGMFGTRTIDVQGVSTLNLNSRVNEAIPNQNGSNYGVIVNAIASVNERISDLGEKLANMQVILDSGALVGQIAGDMDKNLGERTILKGRGN